MQGIKVLIVDDHAIFRKSLRAFLTFHLDANVVGEAADAQSALASVQQLKPDLVLMDIRMPRMGGLEAIQRLKEIDSKIKVVILTAFDTVEHRDAALACGADAFLAKADVAEMLSSVMRQVLQGGFPSQDSHSDGVAGRD